MTCKLRKKIEKRIDVHRPEKTGIGVVCFIVIVIFNHFDYFNIFVAQILFLLKRLNTNWKFCQFTLWELYRIVAF